MRKGINIINNKSLVSKLINSTSFGESVFPAGFNLKTAKEDLNVKGKYGFPPWHLCGKALEGSRSHITKVEGETSPCRWASLPQAHLSAIFKGRFPTAFEDASRSLLKSV